MAQGSPQEGRQRMGGLTPRLMALIAVLGLLWSCVGVIAIDPGCQDIEITRKDGSTVRTQRHCPSP
jgi:hypothetical protein